jgi:glycosyltransferase involved in cell wall biosynthesis
MLSSESLVPPVALWPASVRRPVKMAFLLQDFTMGGISQWIYTVCCELHRTDPGAFEFHFVATHGWIIQERFHRIGTAVFLGRRHRPPNWLVWRRVKAYLRRLAPDIVQFSNLAIYLDICRRVHPPVVIDRKAGMRTLNRYDLDGVDAVICQNRQVFDLVKFEPERKFLIYPGVDVQAFRNVTPNRLGFGPDAFIVGQASRLGGGQNQKLLIDAVIALRRRHPQVKLVLVGGTTPQAGSADLLPALREYAAPLGEHAVLTGAVDEPWELIAGFNVATSTSTRQVAEGVPRKLVEAMAMGIPCVATDSGATYDVVDDGLNGFLVPDGDLDALVRRLDQLIVDESLYRELAAGACETAVRKFNIVNEARKARTAYLTLLADVTAGTLAVGDGRLE